MVKGEKVIESKTKKPNILLGTILDFMTAGFVLYIPLLIMFFILIILGIAFLFSGSIPLTGESKVALELLLTITSVFFTILMLYLAKLSTFFVYTPFYLMSANIILEDAPFLYLLNNKKLVFILISQILLASIVAGIIYYYVMNSDNIIKPNKCTRLCTTAKAINPLTIICMIVNIISFIISNKILSFISVTILAIYAIYLVIISFRDNEVYFRTINDGIIDNNVVDKYLNEDSNKRKRALVIIGPIYITVIIATVIVYCL